MKEAPLTTRTALLTFGDGMRPLTAAAAAWGVARGLRVFVVDAANRFDPEPISPGRPEAGIAAGTGPVPGVGGPGLYLPSTGAVGTGESARGIGWGRKGICHPAGPL